MTTTGLQIARIVREAMATHECKVVVENSLGFTIGELTVDPEAEALVELNATCSQDLYIVAYQHSNPKEWKKGIQLLLAQCKNIENAVYVKFGGWILQTTPYTPDLFLATILECEHATESDRSRLFGILVAAYKKHKQLSANDQSANLILRAEKCIKLWLGM